MQVKLFDEVASAAQSVIETYAGPLLTLKEAAQKSEESTWGIVTGVIGMTGTNLTGNLVLSFDKDSAIHIANQMLCENFTEVTTDVRDAIGEITNMVCGHLKRRLAEGNIENGFNMSTPLVVYGQSVHLSQHCHGPTMQAAYKSGKGVFVIESNLAQQK